MKKNTVNVRFWTLFLGTIFDRKKRIFRFGFFYINRRIACPNCCSLAGSGSIGTNFRTPSPPFLPFFSSTLFYDTAKNKPGVRSDSKRREEGQKLCKKSFFPDFFLPLRTKISLGAGGTFLSPFFLFSSTFTFCRRLFSHKIPLKKGGRKWGDPWLHFGPTVSRGQYTGHNSTAV